MRLSPSLHPPPPAKQGKCDFLIRPIPNVRYIRQELQRKGYCPVRGLHWGPPVFFRYAQIRYKLCGQRNQQAKKTVEGARERERERERAKAHHREGHVIKLGLTCEGVWESEKIPKEKCLFFVYVVRAGFS